MKKFVVIILVLLFAFSYMAALADIYPQVFVIEEIHHNKNIIVFSDYNHNIWEWIGDPEDFEVGDVIAAAMSNNSTKTIYDDIILEIRYAGNLESWE